MANFPTHIAVGTVLSGALATLTLATDLIGPQSLVAVTLAGVVGSVLPDIDLDDSRPSQFLFSGLGILFSFVMLFTFAAHYSVLELWIIWLGSLVAVRYGGEWLLRRISYHRGIFHSLLAGVFFWLLTAVLFKHLLGTHEGVAWLGGGFLFIGFLSHLVLDELYSVDVSERRLKNSFGTALKLIDSKHLGHSAAMAAATALVFVVTPTPKPFVEGITSAQLWNGINQRLLPHGSLFGISSERLARIMARPAPGPVTTGSLPGPRAVVPAPETLAPAEPAGRKAE
jgi:hypothetical protein